MKELFSFAFFPNFEGSINFLAETLAMPEIWDFQSDANKKHQILRNYLEHTYRRLNYEGKIAFTKSNKHVCFNTGLVTSNYESIYAYFEKYAKPRKDQTSNYCFKGFKKRSDSILILHFSDSLPDRANYFNEPELLIFDPKKQIIADLDHIIGDNIDRFPSHLKSADSSELRRQLHGAIEEVKRKVTINYKIAVPHLYRNGIQLLLPLCLTAGSPNPDLALVINKVGNTYSARTCLTLRMAYQNARLIVQPQSEWLAP